MSLTTEKKGRNASVAEFLQGHSMFPNACWDQDKRIWEQILTSLDWKNGRLSVWVGWGVAGWVGRGLGWSTGSRERLIERLIASAPLYELYIQDPIRRGEVCARVSEG